MVYSVEYNIQGTFSLSKQYRIWQKPAICYNYINFNIEIKTKTTYAIT